MPTLLKDTHLPIFEEIDKDNNPDINIDQLSSYVSKKISFICPIGHKYRMFLRSRTKCNSNCPICRRDQQQLLKNTHPLIFAEIDRTHDPGIVIDQLASYSQRKINFMCPFGHRYLTRVANRSYNESRCKVCVNAKKLTYSIEEKEEHIKLYNQKNYEQKNAARLNGDKCDEHVYQLLVRTPTEFKQIKLLAHNKGGADLEIIFLDGTSRFIQVKKLSRDKTKSVVYSVCGLRHYADNMLIAMISIEHRKFCLGFGREFNRKSGSIKISFTNGPNKYGSNICQDEEEFINRLVKSIPESVTINKMSVDEQKEVDMKKRLILYCEQNDLEYKECETSLSTVDCYVNQLRCQLKFVSNLREGRQHYSIHTCKCGGYLKKGKLRLQYPYNEGDFDLLIVEVGGKPEYLGQFCVIPVMKLIEQNIVKTETQKGRISFPVCAPDYQGSGRFKEDWNTLVEKVEELESKNKKRKRSPDMEYLEFLDDCIKRLKENS